MFSAGEVLAALRVDGEERAQTVVAHRRDDVGEAGVGRVEEVEIRDGPHLDVLYKAVHV